VFFFLRNFQPFSSHRRAVKLVCAVPMEEMERCEWPIARNLLKSRWKVIRRALRELQILIRRGIDQFKDLIRKFAAIAKAAAAHPSRPLSSTPIISVLCKHFLHLVAAGLGG